MVHEYSHAKSLQKCSCTTESNATVQCAAANLVNDLRQSSWNKEIDTINKEASIWSTFLLLEMLVQSVAKPDAHWNLSRWYGTESMTSLMTCL